MHRLSLLFPYLLFGLIITVVVLTNAPADSPTADHDRIRCAPCGMAVDPEQALSTVVNGKSFFSCSPYCREQLLADQADRQRAGADPRHGYRDAVCNMEVNPDWGIRSEYRGKLYYFCTVRCKALFDADPAGCLTARCMVCKNVLAGDKAFQATYLGHTYELCSEEHRRDFKADPAAYFMHSMWGIPGWLYYTSIAVVLIVSFGVFDRLCRPSGRERRGSSRTTASRRPTPVARARPLLARLATMKSTPGGELALSLPVIGSYAMADVARPATRGRRHGDRFDLLGITLLNRAARSRAFRFTLQFVVVVLFLMIIAAGLFGNQNPAINIAPLLTWTVWWGLLPVLILFAGKAWCYVCPWDAMAGWIERLRFWKKSDQGLSMNYRWPRMVRNISIATLLFIGLTWVELGFGVTMKPVVTACLAVGMLFLAVLSAMLFEKKSFCRYGCLVGRVSGLYALFGGAEIRSRRADVCHKCRTKECVRGSEHAYGCPTFLYPGKLATNTYCIQCMECVQACPHDNLALNLRPWGSDLAVEGRPRSDEAFLTLLMLSITGFHGLTMTPVWQQLIDWIRGAADFGRVLGFTTGMALIMIAPIGIYAALVAISKQLGGRNTLKPLSYGEYFIRYAYTLLPIALFYHIAHNLEHLLMEGPKVVAMISDPFGWNWNLFGTAGWNVPPLISLENLWPVQVVLVLIGHVYSLWVAQKTSLRLFGNSKAAFRSQLPMLIGMIAFSVFSLWLLKQPMEMRTSAM